MLEVIATVLAIVALFIPGLDIVAALLWIGFGLTALALAGRVMLAATGNGSWLDVALDAFAMLTFGRARGPAAALKAAAEGTEALGKTTVAGERTAMVERALFRSGRGRSTTLTLEEKASVLVKFADRARQAGPGPGQVRGQAAPADQGRAQARGHVRGHRQRAPAVRGGPAFCREPHVREQCGRGQGPDRGPGPERGHTFTAGVGAPLLGGVAVYNTDGSAPVHIGSVPARACTCRKTR